MEYKKTLQLLETLSLTRLDLALNVEKAKSDGFTCFRNGLLQDALSKLTHLENFSLHTSHTKERHFQESQNDSFYISLQEMFPKSIVTIWSNLKQLGLANPFTYADNLYLLLSSRPSLKSIDLDTLFFRADSGTYRSGLHGLNNNLIDSSNGAWKNRQARIAVREVGKSKEYWRRATITNENSSFLNGNRECPFA